MDTSCTNRKERLNWYQLRITISKVRNLTDAGEVIFMPKSGIVAAVGRTAHKQPDTQTQTY